MHSLTRQFQYKRVEQNHENSQVAATRLAHVSGTLCASVDPVPPCAFWRGLLHFGHFPWFLGREAIFVTLF